VWEGNQVGVASLSHAQPLTDREVTFHLPVGETFPDDNSCLSLAVKSEVEGKLLEGYVCLDVASLLRLPYNKTGYNVIAGDEISWEMCSYADMRIETLAQPQIASSERNFSNCGVTVLQPLGSLILDFSICMEESQEFTPYVMTAELLRAEDLAGCHKWGYTKIPGLKKRHVFALFSHLDNTWHMTNACWTSEKMKTDFQGPRCSMPVQEGLANGWNVNMRLFDFSAYEEVDKKKLVPVQCMARAWLARRRRLILVHERNQRIERFTAGSTIIRHICRWFKAKRQNAAALVLQRVMRGYTGRLKVQRMIQSSKIRLKITDIRYIPVLDNDIEGLVPVTCTVYWNNRVVEKSELLLSVSAPCMLFKTLDLALKKIIRGQGQLYHAARGIEHFLVEDADLMIVISKQVATFHGQESHVARLRLDKDDIKGLCNIVTHDYTPKRSYLRVRFQVVTAEKTSIMRKGALKESKSSDAPPSYVVVGLILECERPLWTGRSDRALLQAEPEFGGHHQVFITHSAFIRALLHDIIEDAVEAATTVPLAVDIVCTKRLPCPVSAVGVNATCLVTWEGSAIGSIKMRPLAQSNDTMVPAPGEGLFHVTPSSNNAELFLIFFHEGMFGRTSLASVAVSIGDLIAMLRSKAGQAVETPLDIPYGNRKEAQKACIAITVAPATVQPKRRSALTRVL